MSEKSLHIIGIISIAVDTGRCIFLVYVWFSGVFFLQIQPKECKDLVGN